MTEQEELAFLKDATAALDRFPQVCNIYRQKYDIFTPEGYRKIYDFENEFYKRYGNAQRVLNALIRYVEKSFAPSEEVLRKKAMAALRQEYDNFDSWPLEAQNILLEIKLNELREKRQKHSRSGNSCRREVMQSMNNPELDRPFVITENLIGCKPYKFEFMGKVYDVTSWKKLCAEICTILYHREPDLLEDYVASSANTHAKRHSTISRQPDFFEKPYELTNGFYVCGNCNATYYHKFVRKLLEIYSFPPECLKIYLSRIAIR